MVISSRVTYVRGPTFGANVKSYAYVSRGQNKKMLHQLPGPQLAFATSKATQPTLFHLSGRISWKGFKIDCKGFKNEKGLSNTSSHWGKRKWVTSPIHPFFTSLRLLPHIWDGIIRTGPSPMGLSHQWRGTLSFVSQNWVTRSKWLSLSPFFEVCKSY
jgi:hypothetical protein